MRKHSPVATYVGILVAAVGFGVIAFSWDGAASLDYVQGQFPYLLSGGLTGLGLIVVGVAVMVIETMRRDAAAQRRELGELREAITELTELLSPPDAYDPTVTGEYRPRPRRPSTPAPGDEATAGAGSPRRA